MQADEKNTFRSTQQLKDKRTRHSPSNESNDQLLQSGLNVKQFSYLTSIDATHSFSFTKDNVNESSILSSLHDKYKLIITSILPEDTGVESSDLNQTLDSVIKGIVSLNQLNITSSSVLCVIFIQNIYKQENYNHFFNKNPSPLFNNNANNNCDDNNEIALSFKAFQCSLMVYNSNTLSELQVLIIHKYKLTAIESLECFYNNILPQIKSKNSIIHLAHIANGVSLSLSSLNDMITISNSKGPIVIPCLDTIPIGIFAQIDHYANYQYNLFNMNYYSMNKCLPINHSLSLIRIDDLMLEHIKIYFNASINLDADINYHDYLFSLYLTEKNYHIIHAKNIICSIKRNQITFGQMMSEHTQKISGIFASVLDLVSFWLRGKMTNVSIMNKLSLLFLFIGLFFDFCFPSMMSIVLYAVFNEAFQIKDSRVSIFLTGLYLILIALTLSFSLISKKRPEYIQKLFFTFYITFTVYYLFALVCSVPAIHFIRVNNRMESYQFDTAAFCSIIIINVIFGLIPLLIDYRNFFKKIVYALEYLTLGAAGFTSVFLNHSIVNASDMIGGIKGFKNSNDDDINLHHHKYKLILRYYKSLVIGLYVGTNAFFICILFFMTNRTMRVNGVLSLGIIYTLYNCIKVLLIVLNIFTGNKAKGDKDKDNNKTQSQKRNVKEEKKERADGIVVNNKDLIDHSKHNETNDLNANDSLNGGIGGDTASIDSKKNEKYKPSLSLPKEEDKANQWDHENEIKEKSIEIDIIEKSDIEPGKENEAKEDEKNKSNESNEEKEDEDDKKDDDASESEDRKNNDDNKKEKEDEVNQGGSESNT